MIGGIFCDLEKAFDCVNHSISLSKLQLYSITETIHALLKFCLQDRYKRVLINSKNKYCNTTSDWGKIIMVYLMDPFWDPWSFLIYINDLPLLLDKPSIPILFADESSVLITNSNPMEFKKVVNETFQKLIKGLVPTCYI